MSEKDTNTITVLGITAVVFFLLTLGFRLDLWGHVKPIPTFEPVDPAFTNISSIRTSVAQILEAGGDPTDYDCYFCHEEDNPPELTWETNNIIKLPEEHSDLTMQHGRRNRNDNCYNCHDPMKLTHLKTRDGRQLELAESTLLCGSCHGPTHRDWELGIHGRRQGYWNTELGETKQQGCASCHDPHAPAFPSLEPAPGPRYIHSSASYDHAAHGESPHEENPHEEGNNEESH